MIALIVRKRVAVMDARSVNNEMSLLWNRITMA
jgi:hypothetical protein